ncbi:hypothetical protein MVES1_001320 [Malassezia vespertilionis]|uniref:uncharacterized protein n=1 Tax=Malassezia vespertilionis TaxID=2020962 RepID=UPI0024B0C5D0|nr:uncharacterized protein MVES1_001320 [Malassezia vespertilionis]WFD05982.1 hypothetical protein MVES1_001320 [Malassezia vespertilionis]
MTPVATEGGAVQLPLTDPTDALLQTQYGAWYPHNRSIAPKSTILNLDEMEPDFVKWLDEDGLVLADANDTADPKPRPTRNAAEDDNVMSDASDEDTSEPQFPILNAKIRTVLADYGAIFPKLNWSAPLDAAWIMTSKTLKCQSPNDIYMLIKSSDFAMRDVEQVQALRSVCAEQARPQRPQLELVLKKWFEMPRSHEFRCFVRAGRLIAACQRDITYYEHLQDAPTQEQIVSALHTFFTAHLAPSETRTLRDMVFDVYLTRHLDRCFLIDVNPRSSTPKHIHLH